MTIKKRWYRLRNIKKQGTTILLIEQNANQALKIADRAYVLATGTIKLSGTGAELLTDQAVRVAKLTTLLIVTKITLEAFLVVTFTTKSLF